MRQHYLLLLVLAIGWLGGCQPTSVEPSTSAKPLPSYFLDGADKAAVAAFLERMATISAARSSQSSQANYYNNLGVAQDLQGDYPQALQFHHQALALRQSENNRMDIAKSYNNLAIVYQNQGEYEQAFHLYEQAIAGFAEQAKAEWEAHSRRNFARALQGQHLYSRAKEQYTKTLHIWQLLGRAEQVQLLTLDMDSLAVQAGRSSSESGPGAGGRGGTIRFIEEE